MTIGTKNFEAVFDTVIYQRKGASIPYLLFKPYSIKPNSDFPKGSIAYKCRIDNCGFVTLETLHIFLHFFNEIAYSARQNVLNSKKQFFRKKAFICILSNFSNPPIQISSVLDFDSSRWYLKIPM